METSISITFEFYYLSNTNIHYLISLLTENFYLPLIKGKFRRIFIYGVNIYSYIWNVTISLIYG